MKFQNPATKVRTLLSSVCQSLVRPGIRRITTHWQPYSRLFLASDAHTWVISWEMREVAKIAHHLGIAVIEPRWLPYVKHQSVFYGDRYQLLFNDKNIHQPNHTGMAYFHGTPGTGEPFFDRMYQRLCQVHPYIDRVQVSYSEMHTIVLESGIAPEKVFLIPIGINLSFFQHQTPESRRKARMQYNIPESAVVIGSFQKDGSGWGDGMSPKWVKGPDVFLKTVEILKSRIPELWVLLSGPSRGFVKAELERIGVPYRHIFLEHYPDIGQLYQVLDLYIITSRQEGGPKAVLESMASGVPLVTTRVGQAMDLVQHGQNAWMVDVDDVQGLAYWAEYVLQHHTTIEHVRQQGYHTARANAYDAQIPLWQAFLQGFVTSQR